jgi:hypothetical protein
MNNNSTERKKSGYCLQYLALGISLFSVAFLIFVIVAGYYSWKAFGDWKSIQITEKMIREFYDYTERIKQVSNLQLAERKCTETLKRTVSISYKLPLRDKPIEGSASVEIRCPVTYIYFVDMKGKWSFYLADNVLTVRAPAIQTGAPAIDTSRLEKKTESGWLVFGEDAMMAELERDLTPELRKKALNPDHVELVRETCRKSLEEFVKAWICHGQYEVDEVKVFFADESPENGKLSVLKKEKIQL